MKKNLLIGLAMGMFMMDCIGSAEANVIDEIYGAGAGSFEIGTFSDNSGGYNFMSLPVENNTIAGWTVGGPGGGIDWLHAPFWGVDTGSYAVDLQSNSGVYGQDNSSIATTIPTVLGNTYRLTFGAATTTGYNAEGIVSAGSLLNQAFTATFSPTFASQSYTAFSFLFTATGSTTEIRFTANNPNTIYGPVIDSVNVSAVPIPAAFWLFGSGLVSLNVFRRFNKSA